MHTYAYLGGSPDSEAVVSATPIVMERTFDATLDDVWELWTTKEGIESWWGPDGFRVEVHALDLRAGGHLSYAMIADTPETIAFMKRQGMPASHDAHITYREIVPRERLSYVHLVDFVPGVAKYDVTTVVTLVEVGSQVRMTLRFDRMHDAIWTDRAAQGWEMQLGKLAKTLASRRQQP
jgi:uncharacterized protein YndB with AHSA1/START domain